MQSEEYGEISINKLLEIYQDVKRNTIRALRIKGLSLNEIVRRLGGSSKPVVKKILDETEGGV